MSNAFKTIASALVGAVVFGAAAAAQQPRIENAHDRRAGRDVAACTVLPRARIGTD